MLNHKPTRNLIDTQSKLGPEETPISDPTLYQSLAGSSLVAYSIADWAGCPATRRSISRYCVLMGDNILSWSSKRQHTLLHSSVEAEYQRVANVFTETTWLRNLLREIYTPLLTTTLVYCDNGSYFSVISFEKRIPNLFSKATFIIKMNPQPLDIIRLLPRGIIENILCHVSIKEAAERSVLSREWRTLFLEGVDISKKMLLHLLSSYPSLQNFSLLLMDHNYGEANNDTVADLLKCLPVLEHFTINSWAIEWFAKDVVPRKLATSLVNLKDFHLDHVCFIDKYTLAFIVLLMRSSPNLEKIKLSRDSEDADAGKDYSDIWIEHLNELEIEIFCQLEGRVKVYEANLSQVTGAQK
nr:NBS-containing resistance-like protein [Tanacetum cinerariifolium]GEX77773.1 NBS-containing resistance-like protein [Tanacetum cinerariifolium]GEX77783.1 NBS-containing resistance-like protein [Tanacetum cinerariifolium]